MVTFWYYAWGFDGTNDKFSVMYHDGTDWQTIKTYTYSIDFQNDTFYADTVYINELSYTFPDDMKIRFNNLAGNTDFCHIDEVVVSGTSGSPKTIGTTENITAAVFIPETCTLSSYPNPFNSSTNIRYTLPTDNHVKLEIFDLSGRKITQLFNGYQAAGEYNFNWVAKDVTGNELTTGIYFVKVYAGKFHKTVKMMYVR
jgi:hypothetical protein